MAELRGEEGSLYLGSGNYRASLPLRKFEWIFPRKSREASRERDPSSVDVSTIDPTIELNSCCEKGNLARLLEKFRIGNLLAYEITRQVRRQLR